MDFILLKPDAGFELKDYLRHLSDELAAYGYDIEITDRSKAETTVKKAFLKDESLGKVLELRHSGKTGPPAKIRIKLEVDTNPPSGSGRELQYLDFPFVSAVAIQDQPSLFAGKIHALLCREYVKGPRLVRLHLVHKPGNRNQRRVPGIGNQSNRSVAGKGNPGGSRLGVQ